MPYQPLTNIFARREEKVARFLTMEQLAAGILIVGPALAAGRALPLLLAVPLVAAAAALTLAITLKHRGLAMYERLLWRLRGEIRLLVRGRTIGPEDLAGTRLRSADARAMRRGGAVRVARRHTPRHPRARLRASAGPLYGLASTSPPARSLLPTAPVELAEPPAPKGPLPPTGPAASGGQDDTNADLQA